MVTSKDVAKLAGVSQTTVSRVISNSGLVSEQSRERVAKAMRTLNYFPHRGAQSLKKGRTSTIGIVVSDLLNPAIAFILNSMTRRLDAEGYRALIWHDATDPADVARSIRERAVDGIIFTTATEQSRELQLALDGGTPVLLLNRTVASANCDQISGHNSAGAASVAEYFVKNQRTEAAFLGGTPDASTTRERESGFFGMMARLGHPVRTDRRVSGDYSYAFGFQSASKLLESPEPPTAIFCSNDFMAYGALDAARQHSPDAPAWVVGFDDIPMSAWHAFDLTTVRQPLEEMIETGITCLLGRLDDPSRAPETIRFDCALVVRGSTGNVPAA